MISGRHTTMLAHRRQAVGGKASQPACPDQARPSVTVHHLSNSAVSGSGVPQGPARVYARA